MNDETYFHRLQQLSLMITPPHECSYLAHQKAATLFVDPQIPLNMAYYDLLAQLGFRRSGEHIYRPHCAQCDECKAVRINVANFRLSSSQKRILNKNQAVSLTWRDAGFDETHFTLYQHYMNERHHDSSMNNDDPTQYMHIIETDWCKTRLGEFHINDKLVAVAITDWLSMGLSAVYTFFDMGLSSHSLGTYAILKQIETAQATGRDYVYLGYWIKNCQKMAYKDRFSATEIFNGQHWQILNP